MLLVFLLETMQVWLQWNIIIKVVEKKKKTFILESYSQQKCLSKTKVK